MVEHSAAETPSRGDSNGAYIDSDIVCSRAWHRQYLFRCGVRKYGGAAPQFKIGITAELLNAYPPTRGCRTIARWGNTV